jgi:hypothetical protein
VSRSSHNRSRKDRDYWSRRPFSNKHGVVPGAFSKRRTHRSERQQAKRMRDGWDGL